MKHVVLMVRNYYPYYSAVGVCIGNIAEMLAENHKVTIICEKARSEELNKEEYKNQTILRFISKSTLRRKKIEEFSDSNFRLLYKPLTLINRSYNYLDFITSKDSCDKDLTTSFYETLKSIEHPIDIIVPTCMPFESMLAARKFVGDSNGIEIIPFLFDKFAESHTLHRTKWNKKLKMKRNLALENEIFERSSKILFTPSWEKTLNSRHMEHKSKFRAVEHPLVKELKFTNENIFEKENINIVYAGTVMKETRDPQPVLEIFENIFDVKPNLVLHFYAMGNGIKAIKDYSDKYSKNVLYYGQVSTKKAHYALQSSTILLSIGNKDITQTPSKIFEYISSCKPIIHVAVYKNDPVIEILNAYPQACCICLETDSFNDQITKLRKFVSEINFEKIKFSDVHKRYYNATPEYSIKKLLL